MTLIIKYWQCYSEIRSSCIALLSLVRLSVIILSVIMLSVIMLNVTMLSVIMLSVVAPFLGHRNRF
jgi:hypothetical protein